LIRDHAAGSQTFSGVRVLSKIVPAVTVLWWPQSLHSNRVRLARKGGLMLAQLGQTKSCG
jgi:hypothetical protein